MNVGDKVRIISQTVLIKYKDDYTGKVGIVELRDKIGPRTIYKIKVGAESIYLYDDSVLPYSSLCTCGAKFTSRPNYHLSYCED